MRKSQKKTVRKFNLTRVLTSIVAVLAIILVILFGVNYLNKNNDKDSNSNKDKITQQSNSNKKNEDKGSSDATEPKLIDNSVLQKTIDDAKKVDRSYYTDESLAVLDDALSKAESVIQNNGSQQEVNDANMALVDAIIGLQHK